MTDFVATELMEIGKLTLIREDWNWGSTLELRHIEIQPSPYTNDVVQSDIDVKAAEELIKHLKDFIDKDSSQ